MNVNKHSWLILLLAVLMTNSACSSFSVSGKAGTIKVDTKPKQPNVIVNGSAKASLSVEKT
jgi:hypothetical protein